jgi:hypothetical protein
MDVDDFALSVFAAVLFDVVFMSDLRTIAIGRYRMFVSANNLRYLSMQQCSHVSLLVDYA